MKKLLTDYEFQHESEYYDMVHESYINGQRRQAKEQFLRMPKENQKEMTKALFGDPYNFFFELL